MRMRLALVRAPVLALLAATCGLLLLMSSLTRFVPLPPSFVGWLLGTLGVLVLLAPALLARGSPLPAALAVVVPTLAAASYGASRLDWLRTLKDFGLEEDEGLLLPRMGLALLALLLAWLLHATDVASRLRWRSEARGILPAQARAAQKASLRRGLLHAGLALGGTLLAGGLLLGSAILGPRLLPVGKMAFVAPLLAALLLAAAALFLVGVPRRSTDEG